jgi:RNA polymerase sigma-70 factor (ECF subfamily)
LAKIDKNKEDINNLNFNSEASFKVLFDAYYEALSRYAFTILNDKIEAEDIVQNVYINLWENRMKFEIQTSARALLYKSVYNASLNRLKHLKLKAKHVNDSIYTQDHSYQEQSLDQKELMIKLNQALESLPEQCRKIFEMSRFQQLKYQEIADQLNLSIKTIENQMGKALKILRSALKDYLPIILLIISKIYHG